MTAPRCIVIGAGIVGSCIAWRLVQQGAEVTVVEAGQPGGGATGNSFAWVGASHPGLREPAPYFQLNALGVRAYRRLAAETHLTPWFAPAGCLSWSTDPAEQEATAANVSFLSDQGYNAVLLSRERAMRLEPAAVLPEPVQAVAFFPDEGWVYGTGFAGRLLSQASAAGAAVMTGEAVTGLETAGGATQVRLASGDKLTADIVIVAAGRGSADVLATAGYELPLVPATTRPSAAVGLLVISRPLALPPGHVLIGDDVMIRPDGGGRLIVHDFRVDELVAADTPLAPVPEVATRLLRDSARYVRGADQAGVEAIRIGVRVLPADEMPVVGPVPGYDGVYVCATHSGVTLAPLLAELAAGEILQEADSPLLSTFRPDRFGSRAPLSNVPPA